MKKFIIAVCILVAFAGIAYYAVNYLGFYFDLNPGKPADVKFRTSGTDIQMLLDGGWETFEIRGIDISSSLPGEHAMDFAPDKEDYLRWLEEIYDTGANAVRVYTIMDSDFYDALYEFNSGSGSVLYLLQGIQVSDRANYGSEDAYDNDFRELLIQNGQTAVDAVHGHKIITAGNMTGTGSYDKDISEWVIGYLVGSEWDSGNIAYTNESTLYPETYEGTYFSTSEGSNRFEALMAEIMDRIVKYESDKYKEQRLIAFINDPGNDPFEYNTLYAMRFFKYNQVDAENIKPTEKLRSGYFAAYRLTQFNSEFTEYFTDEQKAELEDILPAIDKNAMYNGYLDLLSRYHTMPVVAAGYGFSSARSPVYEGEEPLTEYEQGEHIVKVAADAKEAGWSGVFVSSWQDTWERRTWNTGYATVDSLFPVWQDVQTDGQCYGLMQFSLSDEAVCLVDGKTDEWTSEDIVYSGGDGTISAKYDEKYIYLLAEMKDFDPSADTIYIPIDTTPESGSTYCKNYGLSFERGCDFVICIGADESRVLVQERYETLWAMHSYETDREDAYEELRDKDSPVFRAVELLVQREDPVSASAEAGGWEAWPTYETGVLKEGNSDPEASDFDSLADYHYTESGVEIRIPWEMLNFGDPAECLIHGDYYDNHGVEYIHIDEMYIGLSDGSGDGRIGLGALELKGWDNAHKYYERLKESYFILQDYWTQGNIEETG